MTIRKLMDSLTGMASDLGSDALIYSDRKKALEMVELLGKLEETLSYENILQKKLDKYDALCYHIIKTKERTMKERSIKMEMNDDSSFIKSVTFFNKSEAMEVELRKSGDTLKYLYIGVDKNLIVGLMYCESPGRFYNDMIKGNFKAFKLA